MPDDSKMQHPVAASIVFQCIRQIALDWLSGKLEISNRGGYFYIANHSDTIQYSLGIKTSSLTKRIDPSYHFELSPNKGETKKKPTKKSCKTPNNSR